MPADLETWSWNHLFVQLQSQVLEDGVRAGTVKPSRDPKARAFYLALAGGGAFLLYLQLHANPTDLRQVLQGISAVRRGLQRRMNYYALTPPPDQL